MDKFSGRSKGFGFVDMPNDEAAKKAITELDNTTIDGRSVKVVEARPREDRPSTDRNFNNERSFNKNRF
jgi:RNA recognition motif-containing protein